MFEKYGIFPIEPTEDGGGLFLDSKKSIDILTSMLDHWEDPDEIREEVLPVIDGVMKGEITDIEDKFIDSDIVGSALVEPDITELYNSRTGYKPMTLPTADFKQLWLEWIELLEAHGRGRSG